MIGREVTTMKREGLQMGGFCLVMESERAGYVTNGASPSSVYPIIALLPWKNVLQL